MLDAFRQLAVGEPFSSERYCFLLVRLQAAENCANLLVYHAYLDGTLVASTSACEAFVEGYSNNYSTMTIPVPIGSTARIERDKMSGDAGTVTITIVEF
jgi:hypothetical protein